MPDSDRIRRIDPARAVEVWHDGAWVAGWQDAWVRWPEGDWRASVSYTTDHEWGRGKYVRSVPEEWVRLPE